MKKYHYAIMSGNDLDTCGENFSNLKSYGNWICMSYFVNIYIKNDCSSLDNHIPQLANARRLIYSRIQR